MKIEIFKPFGEAYELMKKILFQPFDFGRWLVIGFAAFLAGHFSAGGFNYNYRGGRGRNFMPAQFAHWQPWMAFAIGAFAIVFLALILVIGWVRARGTFVFTDCVVRNRAAIAEPWREYRKEGNSYFLFFLAVFLVAAALFAIVVALVMAAGWIGHPHGHTTATTAIALLIFLFICWVSFAIFISVVGYFMAPVMYRQRCSSLEPL